MTTRSSLRTAKKRRAYVSPQMPTKDRNNDHAAIATKDVLIFQPIVRDVPRAGERGVDLKLGGTWSGGGPCESRPIPARWHWGLDRLFRNSAPQEKFVDADSDGTVTYASKHRLFSSFRCCEKEVGANAKESKRNLNLPSEYGLWSTRGYLRFAHLPSADRSR
jgi:hypothetical protein